MELRSHQREATSRQAPVSSFVRLPVEILREIVNSYLQYPEKITTIMHICRRLRHVVLGIHTIWSNILLLSRMGYRPKYRYKDVGDIICAYGI
jgi:hypothetical protein